MGWLGDFVENYCSENYDKASEILKAKLEEVDIGHGVRVSRIWIRPCDAEVCIDIYLKLLFGAIYFDDLEKIVNVIKDVSTAIGLGVYRSVSVDPIDSETIVVKALINRPIACRLLEKFARKL